MTELMTPGSSAIIAGIEQRWIEELIPVLEDYSAQTIRHALDEEISQIIQQDNT